MSGGDVAMQEAMLADFAGRRWTRLCRDYGVWWEPDEPAASRFRGYADAAGNKPVATILKRTTATDRQVYAVNVMGQSLPAIFRDSADAKAVISAAWDAIMEA